MTKLGFVGCALLLVYVVCTGTAHAQCNGNGFANRQVGGVAISADGILSEITPAERGALLDDLRARIGKPSAELDKSVELRMISLRGIEAACRESARGGTALPDEVRYLSGLQRIQFVFVYPDRSDIVLAGPGEGWRVDERGGVVGTTSGRPVLLLSDLLIALRTVGAAHDKGISCSIDPTEAGRREFQSVLNRQKQFNPAVISALEKAMGPQQISITGVPDDCHFAQVMVAADYRMKRLAMGLEKSPIAGLPSYIELLKYKRGKPENAMPRWWLACNYEPLQKSEDGLAWELRGSGVKALTEDDFIDGASGVKGTGKKSPLAQTWADNFTAKYGELSEKETIFGELRNLMDLCVIAALLQKENLWDKAGLEAPTLTAADSEFALLAGHAPKSVSTQCSFLKSGKDYIITASGGVQIESFAVVSKTQVEPKLLKVRGTIPAPVSAQWWWQ